MKFSHKKHQVEGQIKIKDGLELNADGTVKAEIIRESSEITALPAYVKSAILSDVAEGMSESAAAKRAGICSTIAKAIAKEYSACSSSFKSSLKSLGSQSANISMLALSRIEARLLNPDHKFSTPELTILAGVTADKAHKLSSLPDHIAQPEWGKLSMDNLYKAPDSMDTASITSTSTDTV